MVPEIWTATDRIFLILDDYLPFYAPLPPSKFWKNEKKTSEDIITLHKCTINDNHMMYGFWDMKHNRQNFFHSTTKAKTQKQNFEKMKKPCGYIIILKKSTKIMIICCTVPNIWQMMDVIVIFRLGLFFAVFFHFTLVTAQKIKIKKNETNNWRYHHFITHVYQKLWSHDIRFLKYG